MEEIKLNDIADDLLIINKITIDTLFKLENCADCIALYIFYYKTAKWKKTNIIKANDEYVKKSLKWGIDKIRRTKITLKENGLIDIVQRRKDGKIEGWYIEISYIITQRKEISIKVENINNTQNQQVENSTSGNQEANALKEKIKILKNNNINIKENITKEKEIFDYWNTKNIIVHKRLTPLIIKQITKALEEYSIAEIKECIGRYAKVYHDKTYYFNSKWTLAEFLKQSNAISAFTDEGSKWLNYLDKNKQIKQHTHNSAILHSRKYTDEENNDIFKEFKEMEI